MENRNRIAADVQAAISTRNATRRLLVAFLATGLMVSPALGQQRGALSKNRSGKFTQQVGKPKDSATVQLSDKEKRQEKAREIFADAANAQNNGDFPLAIEQWNILLKEYPADPLSSSASHFLGVCYLQQEKPDFRAAIEQFKISL